ncbi:MAG: aminoacyl-tRNA hydrolase [Alphaproteobacteria bacterium]|nr:aminoacyl-tRNA hydrolase [Alphaproteobacteria bacterium]
MAHPKHLIVGLGNPGPEYANTRHNAGAMAVDAIASTVRAPPWQRKFKSKITTANLDGQAFLLIKPKTFMNLSGEAVGDAMRFYKLAPANVIVFHDEVDLPPGKVKVKQGGGHAGHNGLKSVDAHIGPDYWRVRIGVGHPGNPDAVADYVLHDFAKADKVWLEPLLKNIAEYFPLLLQGKREEFIRRLNS